MDWASVQAAASVGAPAAGGAGVGLGFDVAAAAAVAAGMGEASGRVPGAAAGGGGVEAAAGEGGVDLGSGVGAAAAAGATGAGAACRGVLEAAAAGVEAVAVMGQSSAQPVGVAIPTASLGSDLGSEQLNGLLDTNFLADSPGKLRRSGCCCSWPVVSWHAI